MPYDTPTWGIIMKKLIICTILILTLLVAGCSTGNVVKTTYKETCKSNGNMWMTMQPVTDGIPTGDPACPGCMYGNSHFCNEADYLNARGQ